jgi:hypothetical protein
VREGRTIGSVSAKAEWLASTRGKTTSLGRSKSTSVRGILPNQVVRLGRVKPSLSHHQKQFGVWEPGAFPVPQKLNFHVLGELVDRYNL